MQLRQSMREILAFLDELHSSQKTMKEGASCSKPKKKKKGKATGKSK